MRTLLLTMAIGSVAAATGADEVTNRLLGDRAAGKPLVVHVVVALCDNVHQGIVPVPARLGNGSDPDHNLYWGAAYGMRGYFSRSTGWKRVSLERRPASGILMDFAPPSIATGVSTPGRAAMVLACASQPYFKELLGRSGAYPLLLTTGLMAPEAYSLEAAVREWFLTAEPSAARAAAANAYHRYQKCGRQAATRLFSVDVKGRARPPNN